jgi:phosphopantetheinyl transferase
MKESIIKAEGIGLYCPLIDIDTSNDKIKGLNRSWYIKKIFIDDAYSCHVSFGKANETISTINVSKEQIQKIRTSI